MSPRVASVPRRRSRPGATVEDEPLRQNTLTRQPQPRPFLHANAGWSTLQLAALQRRAGNQATLRALESGRQPESYTFMSEPALRAAAIMRWPLQHREDGAIRRISIPRTTTTHAYWDRVPDNHLARVQAAVDIITRQLTSRRLINYFKDNAPGGTVNTLQQVANRAKVWELRTTGSMGRGEVGGENMAYDTDMYRIGRWQIAATLLHEMGHLAGITGAEGQEVKAENTIEAASTYAPWIRRISPRRAAPGDIVTISGISLGAAQGPTDRVTLGGTDVGRVLTWRWRHAGQGQIRFRVPEGATSGPVVVENNTIPSNAIPLTVVAPEGGAEEPAPTASAPPAPAPATAPAPEAED